jgi:UPF0755 protein
MKLSKKNIRHAFYGILALLAIAALVLAYMLFSGNASKDSTVVIAQNATYEQVIEKLQQDHVLKNESSFRLTCKLLFYKSVKPGKYAFKKGESNFSMVKKLRKGQHYPVKFTFNNVRTKKQLIEKLSKQEFYFDWAELAQLLNDRNFLKNYQPFGEPLTPETVIAVFRPDTYEFYYDITAKQFFEKMYSYYVGFWTDERQALAKEIGLTPMEVNTLASIVEEENHRAGEQPRIAGLYMNRLHKDMLLQSDPTVIFAIGDYSIRRVLNQHLQYKSPYNTYLHKGLPPGPIRIPSTCAIDAVLQYEHHDYLYMCAKEDFSGAHNFAKTYSEHLKNARKYQAALNKRK